MDKTVQCFGIGVLDHFGNDHSLARDCADHRCLVAVVVAGPILALALVSVFFLTADIGFVNFDFATKGERITLHRSAPPMADVPAGPPVSTGALAEHHAPDL